MHDSRRPLALFFAAAALALALLGVAAPADARHSRRESQGSDTRQDGRGFTYYVLSLSWSPSYCASARPRAGDQPCGGARPYDFVVHGLWPQFDRGWPEDCAARGGASVSDGQIERMLDLMPSRDLIRHEWQKHGTCSGLSQKDYFEEADEAYHSIKIPTQYASLSRELTVDPAEVRSQFAMANPKVGEQEFVVECSGNGRYLSEVHACLTKDLAGRACNREEQAHQCRSNAVVMRPVR